VEGDVFKDPFPGDHDVLIVANTIHIFSVVHNIELMRKMRAHVRPRTRLLLADFWTDPSHSQPVAAALISGSSRQPCWRVRDGAKCRLESPSSRDAGSKIKGGVP
jgi:hypothetical protein